MKKYDKLFKILYECGILLVGFIVVDVFISIILFCLKLHISVINFWASLIITMLVYLLIGKNNNRIYIEKAISILLFLVILFSSIFVASKIYDSSYDGNSYHKGAIGMMSHGWNPVYETAEDYSDNIFHIRGAKIFTWIDHYQNLSWIFGATVYRVFGNIETAKSLNFLLIGGVLFILMNYFRRFRFKNSQSILLAIVTIFSPVVLSQFFSFYIDGNLAIAFYLYIATISLIIFELIKQKRLSGDLIFPFFFSICILANLKLTGILLIAAGTLPLAAYLTVLFVKKKIEAADYWKLFGTTIASILFAILVIGSTSYVKNTITMHNPFYPLLGDNRSDIITTMQPAELMEKNQLEKLLISIFSRSDNVQLYSWKALEYKLPLTWNTEEINSLNITDTRIGGFGIFYSFIFIISILTIAIYLVKACSMKMETDSDGALKRIIVGCILASILIYLVLPTENWWARYAPNIYLLTPIALAIIFGKMNRSPKNNLIKATLAVFITVIFLNQLPFIYFRAITPEGNRIVKTELMEAKDYIERNPEAKVIINNHYMGVFYNLLDRGIVRADGSNFEFLKREIDREAKEKHPHVFFWGRALY